MKHEYDAIVIGSGIGGLTTAALLSKVYGKKVLVLEKHWTIGGLTHEFERKGKYSWDVGVHYLGCMEEGELIYDLFDFISDGKLKWDKINDPYDIFWYPDLKFEAKSGKENLMSDLIEMFPDESKAIEQYFVDIGKASNWGIGRVLSMSLPKTLSKILRLALKMKEKFMFQSVQDYFNKNFKNEKLKAVLLSQWGDYGVAPSKAVFWIHASVVAHYMNGAYYPNGGAKKIAESIVPVIERTGGKCLSNCEVLEIIVKNNKAIGVRFKQRKGKEFVEKSIYAKKIISNAGAKNTFQNLLVKPIHPEVMNLTKETTAVTIYLGLKENPQKYFDVSGGNFWIFDHYNHNKTAESNDIINEEVQSCFLSFPSLKDRSKKIHTAEIIAFANYDSFSQWANSDWQNRGEVYEEVKNNISDKLLKYLDTKFTGFSDNVEYVEVSTPLSLEKFTNRQGGAMYGLPSTKERFQMSCLQPRTKIKNLYLSGGDTFIVGVCGALIGGFASASVIESRLSILSFFPKFMSKLTNERKTAKATG